MPVPRRLSSGLLAALGLGTSCTATPCLKVAPCLDYAADTDTGPCLSPIDTDTGPCLTQVTDTDTGPCLSPVDSDSDTATGPCLSQPLDSDSGDTGDTGRAIRAGGSGGIAGALTRVLERNVLPEDVVARIRARRGSADQE